MAALSKPAKLVVKLSGFLFAFATAISTPGRAEPALQPHTLFTITKVVPGLFIYSSASSGVSRSSKPFSVSSAFIGNTISSGYISYYLDLDLNFNLFTQKYEEM